MSAERNVGSIIDEMIDHIDYVFDKLKNKTLEDFRADRDIRQSIERSLEIISEASRSLPSQLKEAKPEVPWRQVADFGNVMRHIYFHVDPEVVWEIATIHILPLKKVLLLMRDESTK